MGFAMPASDTRYVRYARETALCVDVAYEALETDLRTELAVANGEAKIALARILARLVQRREALERFKEIAVKAA